MSKLINIYYRLCMTSLFRSVLDAPIFKRFFAFFETNATKSEKIKAYAAFVSEIYSSSLSLSQLTVKYVCEDENVYVKAVAANLSVDDSVLTALNEELLVFQEFAALTPNDFRDELDTDFISPFASEAIDLISIYRERLNSLSIYGYGIFSSTPMFRVEEENVIPILSSDKVRLDSLIGYESERNAVIQNTLAFIGDRPASNVLLCGDAGTGKSSTVKAIVNHFFDRGLRLIEIRKDQLSALPRVIEKIRDNPLKFIIFIDDLSFNQNDDNFSMLKAALEGSASAVANNALIYATSNRRHIIKESFNERDGDDVHRNDTMQELLSLSDRFGLVVSFYKPSKKLYLDIVFALADRYDIAKSRTELEIEAEAFALRRGNRSARCAEQFIKNILNGERNADPGHGA